MEEQPKASAWQGGWSAGGLGGQGCPWRDLISLQELSGATATGDERQICYVLKAAEAGWMLRPSSVPAV
jgi:hypothetical protein